MAQNAHTPGPWYIINPTVVPIKSGMSIYHKECWVADAMGVHVGPPDESEIAANAALISAAPDLLASVGELLLFVKHFIKSHDFIAIVNAEAAIAKATNTELSK